MVSGDSSPRSLERLNRYFGILDDKDFYFKAIFVLAKFLKQSNGVPDYLDEGARYVEWAEQYRNKKQVEKSNIKKTSNDSIKLAQEFLKNKGV